MKRLPEDAESDFKSLTEEILTSGYVCRRCGACCREVSPGSNIVMVSPGEVRAIMKATGLLFDEVAEPYPDTIRENDREYTLGWAIRRTGEQCRFLTASGCQVYENRPWICRTYPFMLDRGKLRSFPCEGIRSDAEGLLTTPSERVDTCSLNEEAEALALVLRQRQAAEEAEEQRIAAVFNTQSIPQGRLIVIDGEGIRVING
ncbi:MAG TPA: YkgJ family cysteine cluster protein [Methanospirillum sp.]|nr:YkgJ family cysteine cluster protein [Methanospirillum sp.]